MSCPLTPSPPTIDLRQLGGRGLHATTPLGSSPGKGQLPRYPRFAKFVFLGAGGATTPAYARVQRSNPFGRDLFGHRVVEKQGVGTLSRLPAGTGPKPKSQQLLIPIT